jgi:hypothetical protein
MSENNMQQLMEQKLDPILRDIVKSNSMTIPVIIQTEDGLKDVDRKRIEELGGKVKDDLYIINAFSADISTDSIRELIKDSRVKKVYFDSEVRAI